MKCFIGEGIYERVMRLCSSGKQFSNPSRFPALEWFIHGSAHRSLSTILSNKRRKKVITEFVIYLLVACHEGL